MAEHEERDRIAQILHDELQQQLYAVRMQLQMVIPSIEEAETRQEAEQMGERLGDAFQLTRQLSVDLSPPILAGEGLGEAIRWLAAQMEERHNLAVTVTTASEGDAWPPPPPDRRMLIFQMVRELLFNVVKHAAVPRATVQLRHEALPQIGPACCIDVIDEGPGFDPEAVVGGEGAAPHAGAAEPYRRPPGNHRPAGGGDASDDYCPVSDRRMMNQPARHSAP
jgi:two-component system CheB/CheR fusion protein